MECRASIHCVVLVATACAIPPEGVEPGSCADRADNDGDYMFDCDDPGCADAPECAGMGSSDSGWSTAGDACNANDYTLTFEDDSTLILNSWIWQEGWGGAHLVGLATGDRDGCSVAAEFFTEFTGYESWFFQIDIPVLPESGSLVRIQETASGSVDGTARVENLTTGALETSLDGGRMSVDRVSLEGGFQASNVYARMSGGTAPQGDLVACWCDATPIGPDPDD